ncbi:hypothetical protein GBAR_LOCUS7518 [Geodia barretti]|uniref:Uncharacterized protein n=1 Tax=Geodia barretti TaxID=519541 RepID=A0AA35RJ83_GEOBA|nr:hypothetical protein GBAR_LOCUS7518 [Geodia barretti]
MVLCAGLLLHVEQLKNSWDHLHTLYRGLFTLAVGGSAYVVRSQVTQKRRKQEEEGVRSAEKLSWEERLAVEEQRLSPSQSTEHNTQSSSRGPHQ